MSALSIALDLAAQGLSVFPCRSNKKPATPNGFYAASRDPAVIRTMWHRFGGTLIGLPTGKVNGVDLLDIDPRHGGDVWLHERVAEIPKTRTHRTRSGGTHFLLRHCQGVRNSESKIAPGVDVRGQGGYLIWWPGLGGEVTNPAPIAEWPAWLTKLIIPKIGAPLRFNTRRPIAEHSADVERLLTNILFRVCTAAGGERHTRLRAAACTLGGFMDELQLPETEVSRLLLQAVQQAGGDAVNINNARATIAWGINKGRLSPLKMVARHAR